MAPDIVADENGGESDTFRPMSTFQRCPTSRNFKKESERLKTFKNWTVSFLDSKKLAKLGFYYTNTEDVVRCAFCDIQIGFWKQGDNPELDHRQKSPDCPFVRGQDCGNLVQSDSSEEREENKEPVSSQDVCGSYGLDIRPYSGPERPGKVPFAIQSSNLWRDFEELGVSKISGPVSPAYATYNSRLKTYENWKIPEIQSPEKLAEAGFYYTSVNDNVLCFHCGGGLKNWEVEDDPWVEHAHWFSKCGFVLIRKGRAFVIEVLSKNKAQPPMVENVKGLTMGSETNLHVGKPEEKKPEKQSASSSPTVSTPSSSDEESLLSKSPNSDGKEIELCRICYVRERGIVFLPCGHFVSCPECAPSLSTCAVCRKPFEATVRAYLS